MHPVLFLTEVVISQVGEKLALVPGKLDHATVVAYCVGPFDPNSPPTPEEPLVQPLDFMAHLNTRHHTRPKNTCLQTDPYQSAYTYAAPLASPDSSRSIASEMAEAKIALPKLPESSPPRSRASLAREESVETLIECNVEIREEPVAEVKPIASRPRQYGRRGKPPTESSTPPLPVNFDNLEPLNKTSKDQITKHSNQIDIQSDKCCEDTVDSVPLVSVQRVESVPPDNQRLDAASQNCGNSRNSQNNLDRKLSLSLKESNDKENLSPNVVFEMPCTPVVETLL